MAEEVNYASVVFKNKKTPPPQGKKEEETVYDEVKVKNETPEKTDSNGFLPDSKENNRRRHYQLLACCLVVLCVVLVIGIVAVSVYLTTLSHQSDTSELEKLKENQTSLLADNRNLTQLNNKLVSEIQNLTRERDSLRVQFDNLTQAYNVSVNNNNNLTAENQELKTQNLELNKRNQNLTTRNQQLETQRNNLTEQIQNMETNSIKLNVSRAQWSIEAYCPKNNNVRVCAACQPGWLPFQSSCYAIVNPGPPGQETWEEAQGYCRGNISDLVVIVNDAEKKYISDHSWSSSGTSGYWIGLRVEDGKWKWVGGSELTESSWIQTPANGQCAISVYNQGWKSVSCGDRNRWICKKSALTLT